LRVPRLWDRPLHQEGRRARDDDRSGAGQRRAGLLPVRSTALPVHSPVFTDPGRAGAAGAQRPALGAGRADAAAGGRSRAPGGSEDREVVPLTWRGRLAPPSLLVRRASASAGPLCPTVFRRPAPRIPPKGE